MTTTPTLYVKHTETKPHIGWTWDRQLVRTKEEHSYTPATHDELIAAMPRCGTCEWARERTKAPASPDRKFCTWLDCPTKTDFGCTEHKEKQ